MFLLFDADRRLRNGWWMLLFVLLIAATRFVYAPLAGAARGIGLGDWVGDLVAFLLTLAATWVCVRLRGESLASVGWRIDGRWLRELGLGAALGVGAILAIAGLIASVGGVAFAPDPGRSGSGLVLGLQAFLLAALLEENLFRGFLFQRLVAGTRFWIAQLLLAALFAIGHWDNPGMSGVTKAVASVDLALGAILFGLAWQRTRSLAVPVGLHVGWNWAQGSLLGFGVSGLEHAGWFRPVYGDRPDWLTGGTFGPEASAFALLVDVLLIAAFWGWTAPSTDAWRPARSLQRLATAARGQPPDDM